MPLAISASTWHQSDTERMHIYNRSLNLHRVMKIHIRSSQTFCRLNKIQLDAFDPATKNIVIGYVRNVNVYFMKDLAHIILQFVNDINLFKFEDMFNFEDDDFSDEGETVNDDLPALQYYPSHDIRARMHTKKTIEG